MKEFLALLEFQGYGKNLCYFPKNFLGVIIISEKHKSFKRSWTMQLKAEIQVLSKRMRVAAKCQKSDQEACLGSSTLRSPNMS